MAIRSPTAISQAFEPAVLVMVEDLVTGLSGNPKLTAQTRSDGLATLETGHR